MTTDPKPFRCEASGCSGEEFYHTLTKPSCPKCKKPNKVVPLCVVHLLIEVDEGGDYDYGCKRIACGVEKPTYLTDQSKVATCYSCLSVLKNENRKT